ncbi:MAG: ComF family protein [Firmicutes bacterium]|nr:ComF family protein [Bacillota bacterium]
MNLIEEILDFLYPPRCIVCGKIALKIKDDKALCGKCRKNIPWIENLSRCDSCSVPLENGNVCTVCKGREKSYKKAISVFEYSDVKTTVEDYKFKSHKYLSVSIGSVMFTYISRFYPDILKECDVLCPVPIHSTRLKERGYDQSALIGKIISEKSGIEYKDILVRVRPTSPQSLIKGFSNREANVKGAFKVNKDVIFKKVLLIDDVLTTGNSANECAKELLKAGARDVYVFTFAASYKQTHDPVDR